MKDTREKPIESRIETEERLLKYEIERPLNFLLKERRRALPIDDPK